MRIIRNWIDLWNLLLGKLFKVKPWKAERKVKGIGYLCLLKSSTPCCRSGKCISMSTLAFFLSVLLWGERSAYIFCSVDVTGTPLALFWASGIQFQSWHHICPLSQFRLYLSWPYSYAVHKPSITHALVTGITKLSLLELRCSQILSLTVAIHSSEEDILYLRLCSVTKAVVGVYFCGQGEFPWVETSSICQAMVGAWGIGAVV